MAVDFIKEWLAENPGKNVVCLFNLQCLLPQFEASFAFHGMRDEVAIFHDDITRAKDGTMMVKHQDAPSRRVMLTMPETLAGNMFRAGCKTLTLDDEWLGNVGLILIDEAHKGTSNNYQEIRDYFDCQVLGLTATPQRANNDKGECLANDWEYELVTTLSIQELIDMGRLVKPLYYPLDDSGDCFTTWLDAIAKHSKEDGNIQTMWVCRDTKAAKEWTRKLIEAGQSVERITSVDDDETSKQTTNQREAIFKQFDAQEINHLVSVNALCEGFDAPIAKYVIVDRGVTTRALWQQIIGRVLRPYKGKTHGHVIDRGGNHAKHGEIEDYIWNLDIEPADEGSTYKMGERKTLGLDRALNAKNIQVTCETHGCVSRYNARKHLNCPHCNTAHGRKVAASAVAWMAHLFPQFKEAQYGNVIVSIQQALKGDPKAFVRVTQQIEDIILDDGNFNPKYAAVQQMNAKNLKKDVELDLLAA